MTIEPELTELKAFFKKGRLQRYHKGSIILYSGEVPSGVYYIESGVIKIYALTKDGQEHIHHFFGPGDFFPMTWIFQGYTRNLFYQPIEKVTIRVVPREDFLAFVMKNRHNLMEVLDEMVLRYIRYSGRTDNLLYTDARERCAYRLLSLANRFGQATKEGLKITAPITQEDMAHSLSMTRETFGRVLNRFQARGIIAHDDHHIVIKDLKPLIKIIGEDETKSVWPGLSKYLVEAESTKAVQ
jgi:CRP-like cAMP-binding protein